MTLGRTPAGSIKIKTDTEGGGLRAVGCACCGGACKTFRFNVLGLMFVAAPTGINAGIPYESNDNRGFRCDASGGAGAGGVATYTYGTDFYCDGGNLYSESLRTGGDIAVSFTYFLSTNTIEGMNLIYRKSLDAAGNYECIQDFFCERGKDNSTTETYHGSGISFPAQNGTYQIPVTYTYAFSKCFWDYENPQEGYTNISETTILITVENL
jgi:hypothetical protein